MIDEFSPEEIAEEIGRQLPGFEIKDEPDYRQRIADSWPDSIDDSPARRQWGWEHRYDLGQMVKEMLDYLSDNPDIVSAGESG